MNSIIPVPQALNISPESRSYNWDLFQQAWNNYEIAVGLSEKSNEQRVATLLSIIGYDALQVYNAFYWNNDEQKTVESVMNKFGVYCKPKKNVTYERFTFILLVEDVLKSYRWNEFLLLPPLYILCSVSTTYRTCFYGRVRLGAAVWALDIWALDIWAPGLSGARFFVLASFFCSYVVLVCNSLRSR